MVQGGSLRKVFHPRNHPKSKDKKKLKELKIEIKSLRIKNRI